MVFVHENLLDQPTGSPDDEPTEPRGPGATGLVDVPFATLQQATLRSERIRIIGLIFVLCVVEVVIAIRALFGGVPGQFEFLPRFTALILSSVAYESLMLGMVNRAMRREGDLPLWAWSANAGIEALLPTIVIILITENAYMGPYGALSAPAAHGYYIFIILSTLRLRPGLCFLTGVTSALGFAAATAYTFVVHPAGRSAGGPVYPLQVYATYGVLYLICGAIAAWLSSQFRQHVLGALGEAAVRGQYERLVREVARRESAEQALRASERRYRQLTEETRDAVVVADEQGLITLFNRAAETIFGYAQSEVLRQPLTNPDARGIPRGAPRRFPALSGYEGTAGHRPYGRGARPGARVERSSHSRCLFQRSTFRTDWFSWGRSAT